MVMPEELAALAREIEGMPLGPARLGRFIELARLRHRPPLKQGELARLAELKNASYLSQIEAGQRTWPKEVMPKIAEALGVHQAELAYHAGVITEPLPGPESDRNPFRPTDRRAKIVKLLEEADLPDHQLLALVEVIEGWMRS
jgi:transcriptional regulator with XRE-family HTH domain